MTNDSIPSMQGIDEKRSIPMDARRDPTEITAQEIEEIDRIIEEKDAKSESGSIYKLDKEDYQLLSKSYIVIGKGEVYAIGSMLGKGSFAIVKELTHYKNPTKKLAIKIESGAFKGDQESSIEIAILKALNRCKGYFQRDRGAQHNEEEDYSESRRYKQYNIQTLIEGKQIFESFFKEDKELGQWTIDLPLVDRIKIAIEIAKKIEELHEQGIIHGDIKAGNIILNVQGHNVTVQLVDFGNAHQLKPEDGEDGYVKLSIDEHNIGMQFMSDPYYIPPESMAGIYGYKGDVYAFGVLMNNGFGIVMDYSEIGHSDYRRRPPIYVVRQELEKMLAEIQELETMRQIVINKEEMQEIMDNLTEIQEVMRNLESMQKEENQKLGEIRQDIQTLEDIQKLEGIQREIQSSRELPQKVTQGMQKLEEVQKKIIQSLKRIKKLEEVQKKIMCQKIAQKMEEIQKEAIQNSGKYIPVFEGGLVEGVQSVVNSEKSDDEEIIRERMARVISLIESKFKLHWQGSQQWLQAQIPRKNNHKKGDSPDNFKQYGNNNEDQSEDQSDDEQEFDVEDFGSDGYSNRQNDIGVQSFTDEFDSDECYDVDVEDTKEKIMQELEEIQEKEQQALKEARKKIIQDLNEILAKIIQVNGKTSPSYARKRKTLMLSKQETSTTSTSTTNVLGNENHPPNLPIK